MTRHLLFLALAASCAACATILDFQEPTDKLSVDSLSDAGLLLSDAGLAPVTSSTADGTTLPEAGATPGPAEHPPKRAAYCPCLPDVASDWRGPFVVSSTSDGSAPAACDGAYPTEAYAGFAGAIAPAASCSCSCGDPTNVACSAPQTTFFSDSSCGTTCQTTSTGLACAAVNSYSCDPLSLIKPKAMAVGASVPSGGACLAIPKVDVAPLSWRFAVRLCASAAPEACGDAGCPATPSAGFAATNRCVMKAGDNACPAAYPAKQVYHLTGTDTRACTACTCGAPANVNCVANVSTFNGASCTSAAATLAAPTSCLAVTTGMRLTVDSATPRGGACLAVGGLPTGAFAEDAPTTICCLQ